MDSHWNSVKNDLSGFSGFSLLSLAGPFTNNENSSSVTIFWDLSMLMSIKKLNIVLWLSNIPLFIFLKISSVIFFTKNLTLSAFDCLTPSCLNIIEVMNIFLKYSRLNWYIGSILLIEATTKYNILPLSAIGTYSFLNSFISFSIWILFFILTAISSLRTFSFSSFTINSSASKILSSGVSLKSIKISLLFFSILSFISPISAMILSLCSYFSLLSHLKTSLSNCSLRPLSVTVKFKIFNFI